MLRRSVRCALPRPDGFCIFGGLLFARQSSTPEIGRRKPTDHRNGAELRSGPHGKRPSARNRNRSGRLRCWRLRGRLGRWSRRRGTPTTDSGLFLGCFFLSRLFSRLFFGCASSCGFTTLLHGLLRCGPAALRRAPPCSALAHWRLGAARRLFLLGPGPLGSRAFADCFSLSHSLAPV